MRIPTEARKKEDFIKEVVNQCKMSRRDRQARYERRRRWFLFGQDEETPVRYNRLASHTDLVSSFLFSPQGTRFSISNPEMETPQESEKMVALADYVAAQAVNSGLLIDFSDAVDWSLVYDTEVMKLGWNDARSQAMARLIYPGNFCVYDETEAKLVGQEAFCHCYHLTYDDAERRARRAGKAKELKKIIAMEESPQQEDYPPIMRALQISVTGGGPANPTGPIVGQASTDYTSPTDYRGVAPTNMIPFTELWIWDNDQASPDYRQFLIAGDDILLEDSKERIEGLRAKNSRAHYGTETNLFLPGETPFVPLTPYRLPEYFFGKCPLDTLGIPLQSWTNERLQQIAYILERQVDPARVFSGFGGLPDEKALTFGSAHSWVTDDNPQAKVDELRPDMPEDLFREFDKISELFMEAFGLTQTVTGQGQPGVRSESHARQLAQTGSGRIKKVAIGLESPLSDLGDLLVKLILHNDKSRLTAESGESFIPGEIEGDLNVNVAGHSHSPLFVDDTKEMAEKLMKFSAIDRESLLKLENPPDVRNLIQRLRKIEAKEALALATGQQLPGNTKGEQEAKRSHHKQGN